MHKVLSLIFCCLTLTLQGESETSYFLDELQAVEEETELLPPSTPQQLIIADESDGPDSGNWYEKLRWWKEARTMYTEDIQLSLQEITLLQEEYDQKHKDIIEELERYSASLSIKRQAMIPLIDQALQSITKRQEAIAKEKTQNKKPVDPTEGPKLDEQAKLLNELKIDINDLNMLADRVKQSFDQVVPQQLSKAQNYDKEALEAYESIEHTLDDKKAHRSFELVENCHDNIVALIGFLRGPLWNFIDASWSKIKTLMPKVTTTLQTLESKGVSLKQPVDETDAIKKPLEKDTRTKDDANRPWWQKIWDAIVHFFSQAGSLIWYGISQPFRWVGSFFSTNTPSQKPDLNNIKKPSKEDVKPLSSPAESSQVNK